MPLIVKSNYKDTITNMEHGIREIYEADVSPIPIMNIRQDLDNLNVDYDLLKGWVKTFEEYHFVKIDTIFSTLSDFLDILNQYRPKELEVVEEPKREDYLEDLAGYNEAINQYKQYLEKKIEYEEALKKYKDFQEWIKSAYSLSDDFDFENGMDESEVDNLTPTIDIPNFDNGLKRYALKFDKTYFGLSDGSTLFTEGVIYADIKIKEITFLPKTNNAIEDKYMTDVETGEKVLIEEDNDELKISKIVFQDDNICHLAFDPTEYTEGKTSQFLINFSFDKIPDIYVYKNNEEQNTPINNEWIKEINKDPLVNNEKAKNYLDSHFEDLINNQDYIGMSFVLSLYDEVLFTKSGTVVCCSEIIENI